MGSRRLPLIFGSIHQVIAAIHASNSSVGSFKDGKQEIKWDNRETSKSASQTYRVVYYAY
ncbi:hypothetical protein [Mycoplasma sp. ATU-Cv-508]|uniref:hypothetical protein n=1 Tax=Mycoplasma sp. ATU-Cv-508 TaxID=2048001 RepID=UPI000FDD1643